MKDFRLIYLPPFKVITSGADHDFDFSIEGKLGKFDNYFSNLEVTRRDEFSPRDFLFYDEAKKGLVWWYVINEDIKTIGYEKLDFDGGYYITYHYKDGDSKENEQLYAKALKYIEESKILELDIHENHYSMGHIITPKEIIVLQGWAQMETFIPVKVSK